MKQKSLLEDLADSSHELRGSVVAVLSAVGVDAPRPPALTKRLRLDKSLAWKLATIIKSDEPGLTVKHLPGEAAFDIFLSAAKNAGADVEAVQRAAAAYRNMQHVFERHAGDRPTLELVMDSMPGRSSDRLVVSRKLAFRGNSGIWGVQAKTRINTAIIAPSRENPELLDAAVIGGWVDFRRLRADSRWALFRRRIYGPGHEHHREPFFPIDPDEPADGPMLLRQFCTASLPPIDAVHDDNGDLVYELGPSSIGNTGAFTCFFGSRVPQIGARRADEANDQGQFSAVISAPVEALQFDLLVHRDCEFVTRTRVDVYGVLTSPGNPRDRIPLELQRLELGRYPAVVDTPRVTHYRQIVDHVMSRCGWDRNEFVGVRYVLDYPPFPSTVVISFPLEVP